MRNIIFSSAISFLAMLGCQNEAKQIDPPSSSYLQIFDLGDTVHNNSGTMMEESNIVLDTTSQYRFKLTSTHQIVPNQSSSYFVRIEFDFQDKVRFLSSLANGGAVFSGPLLSTFTYGDTIDLNNIAQLNLSWYPETEIQIQNTGWLKYHIFTPFQQTIQNIQEGENYFVFKFGETGNERIGWINVYYQDTLCYLKDGYYFSEANQGIVVGKQE